jgi:type II secretory pathway component HofQ
MNDCNSYVQLKKVERKPRAKKAVSPEKLTRKFKFLKEFDELKNVWLYHILELKNNNQDEMYDVFVIETPEKNYKKILKNDGVVNLKTDSEFMHGYTLGLLHGEGHEVLYANHNVYVNEGSPEEVTAFQTFYEKQYLEINKAITYIRFKIKE